MKNIKTLSQKDISFVYGGREKSSQEQNYRLASKQLLDNFLIQIQGVPEISLIEGQFFPNTISISPKDPENTKIIFIKPKGGKLEEISLFPQSHGIRTKMKYNQRIMLNTPFYDYVVYPEGYKEI